MKIEKFEIIGLFGLYNHTLDFNQKNNPKHVGEEASVIMLFGKNGVGKTTILKMLECLMAFELDLFYSLDFVKVILTFSNRDKISISKDTISDDSRKKNNKH